MLRPTLTILLLLAWGAAPAQEGLVGPLAPGYARLSYVLPAAGSYRLPPVAAAADGELVDSDGSATSLYTLFGERYVLLSFMYSDCNDVNGCPLTAYVFNQLYRAMARDPVLAQNLRLVSFSFDPLHDTPAVMKQYARGFFQGDGNGRWRFATTRSEQQLAPILQAYGQEVQRRVATGDSQGGGFFHLLRVFLIDPQHRVRNIYSVEFLHAEVILNDLNTLLLAELKTPGAAAPAGSRGQPADLLAFATTPPRGLPPLSTPPGLQLSPDSIALGRKLFFDRRLSLNNTVSCAMCHVPEQGFTNNQLATAVGIEGRSVGRNAPSLYNVGFSTRLFHDGREDQLAQQVWAPLLAKNEMGNPSVGFVVNRIRQLPDYSGMFELAFNNEGPGMQRIGDALAAYQLTLNAADSPFDRWYFGGDEAAVSPLVKQGFKLFQGRAGCGGCHLVEQSHALFSDYSLHNTGIGYVSSGLGASPAAMNPSQTVQLAPGVEVEVDRRLLATVGEPARADLGRYEITQNPADRWKFKTPSLRNVALSSPYMHDGSLTSLRQVVQFYNEGGIANPLLDPALHPLHLGETEIQALIALLESLTGSNVPLLVADALAAPIGDPRPDSPPPAGPLR